MEDELQEERLGEGLQEELGENVEEALKGEQEGDLGGDLVKEPWSEQDGEPQIQPSDHRYTS